MPRGLKRRSNAGPSQRLHSHVSESSSEKPPCRRPTSSAEIGHCWIMDFRQGSTGPAEEGFHHRPKEQGSAGHSPVHAWPVHLHDEVRFTVGRVKQALRRRAEHFKPIHAVAIAHRCLSGFQADRLQQGQQWGSRVHGGQVKWSRGFPQTATQLRVRTPPDRLPPAAASAIAQRPLTFTAHRIVAKPEALALPMDTAEGRGPRSRVAGHQSRFGIAVRGDGHPAPLAGLELPPECSVRSPSIGDSVAGQPDL